ncbi:MAG TPA: hypothetical protein VI197_22560 [Polyangiaceae bacterium]
MKFLAVVVAALVLIAPALAFAAPKACSCKNLESIQQELANALYLAKFQADLATKVKQAEDDQRDLRKKNPSHPLAKYPVEKISRQEWEKLRDDVSLPFPQVKGYTGPNSVGLIEGECKNQPNDLKALADGASCKELGTITLKHEQEHRDLCTQMGKAKYWKRLFSEIAAEEADRYTAQAKAIRVLLKKVIDGSTVKVSEETDLKITSGPMEYNYHLSMPAFKLTGKSSPGKDTWELKGTGARTVAVTSVKIPGMTCTPPTQKLPSKVTGTLELDGLKMKLDQSSVTEGGSLTMTCKIPGKGQGFGYGVAPPGERGSGEVFKDADVKLKSSMVENVAQTVWGKAINQTGVSASGTSTTKLTITCAQ